MEQFLGLVVMYVFNLSKIYWDYYPSSDLDVDNVGTISRSLSYARNPEYEGAQDAEVAGSTRFCYQPYKLWRTAFNRYSISRISLIIPSA